jgi:elongation factor G
MKAILWHDETMGAEYEVGPIPADLLEKLKSGETRCLKYLLNAMIL